MIRDWPGQPVSACDLLGAQIVNEARNAVQSFPTALDLKYIIYLNKGRGVFEDEITLIQPLPYRRMSETNPFPLGERRVI